jgi:hypothetical protein
MIRLLGNGVNAANPHGIPAQAWINAKNLRVFSQLYDQSLSTAHNLADARQAFIRQVLAGLESGDRTLSAQGRLASLQGLSQLGDDKAFERTLAQTMQELDGKLPSPERLREFQTLLTSGKIDALHQELLEAGWGTLSKPVQETLLGWFSQKVPGDTGVRGTMPLDHLARQRVQETAQGLSEPQRAQAFRKARLSISRAHLNDLDPEFTKAVDELVLNHGLTSVVHLKDSATGKTLLSGQSRKTLLGELKYFLEHYADRAAFQAENAAKTKGLSAVPWAEQRTLVREALFAAPSRGLRGLLPHLEDGLVTAALKGKRVYTWVPILIAVSANGIATFLNNYVTRRKYGGKVFFPGEEAFAQKGRPQAAPARGRLA